MNCWLKSLGAPLPESLANPEEIARFELEHALKQYTCSIRIQEGMGDSWQMERNDTRIRLTGGHTGILYGAYAVIFRCIREHTLPESWSSHPAYSLRMINCWDNPDGSVERGYAGRSLFFSNGALCYDPDRIRRLARLLCSVGLNTLCINNVNVHDPAQNLLEDALPDLARLAGIFRPFGIRLLVSVDFSHPIRHGLSADPLDESVRLWWKETARRVYAAVPDLAGFLVKADSENRPGPNTYGRSHAEGANMLAEALQPYGGRVVWRAFVYNCHQDWRDRQTDRPKAAYAYYKPQDGLFAENVILQVKHGPFDFQVREPLSPLLLGMEHTALAMELQLTQEYTGHQIDLYTMLPMWQEIFEELPADRIMSLAAVANFGLDGNLTGHPLAAVNLFGYGLLAWNPAMSPEQVIRLWVSLTYRFSRPDEDRLVSLLLSSRRIYEKYTAPLGIGWMVTPHVHYGPSPDGYEYDAWGTYHKANREQIGIDRTAAGTGYTEQYPESLRAKYSSVDSCPELLLLFFHRLPYSFRMKDGRTLIQRIYDDHFEGAREAEDLAVSLGTLPFPEPDRSEILRRAELQVQNAGNWRDVINTFLYRLSGVPDSESRTIYE